MKYEFYADVFFLTNFYLDFLAVYAVGEILQQKKHIVRYIFGSACSSLLGCILFVYMRSYRGYMLCMHGIVNPGMVLWCFYPSGKKIYGKAFLLMYVVLFLEGGFVQWLYLTVADGKYYELCVLFTAVLVYTFLYILRRKKKSVQTFYQVRIVHKGKEVKIRALYDTGNRLWDPYVESAVHVVDAEVFAALGGKAENPVRLLPFASIGQKSGLLETFTAESMYIQCAYGEIQMIPVVLAVAEHGIFKRRNYQMILHHSILEKIEKSEGKICT